MLYSLKRIFHNIRRNLGVYLIFILEFAIGAMILSGTLNVTLSLKDDLKEEQEKMQADIIQVMNAKPLGYFETEETPWEERIHIPYDMYRSLEDLYGDDLILYYGLLKHFGAFCQSRSDGTEIFDFDLWFTNDAKFEELFGIPMEKGKIYAYEDAYNDLIEWKERSTNPKYIFDSFEYADAEPIKVEKGKIYLNHKEGYELVKTPPCEKEYLGLNIPYVPDEAGSSISRCVFVSLDEYPEYERIVTEIAPDEFKNGLWIQSPMDVKYKTADFEVNVLPEMLSYMSSERNGLREFKTNQGEMELQDKIDSIDSAIIMLTAISCAVMIIVVLGTTGLFIIFFHRRRKQMAVSIAYGSTYKRLLAEIFIEIFIVTEAGAVLGAYAAKFIMPYAVEMYANTTAHPVCTVIILLSGLVCSVMTALLCSMGIGNISPAKVLKDL